MASGASKRKVQVDVDRMTFGVEIECLLPRDYVQGQGIVIHGYHQRGEMLPSPFPAGWMAQKDGSLHAEPGLQALELVSPILKGRRGLEDTIQVYEVLNEAGAQVNSSCGLHVHVGMDAVLGRGAHRGSLVVRWVRRMLHLMSRHELGVFAVTGQRSRSYSNYCATIKAQWDGVLKTTSSYSTLKKHTQEVGRYHSLNLCNLFKDKRTVEFRLFAATLNGMQALGHIITALGIAHRAAEVGTVQAFDAGQETITSVTVMEAVADLQKVLRNYGWPTGAKKAWGKAIRKAQQDAARKFVGGA